MAVVARVGGGVACVGALLLAIGGVTAPDRIGANVLLAGYALAGLGLAGAFFTALCYVADATWAVAFRRVPESLTRVLPAAAVLLGAVFLAYPALYPWTGAEGDALVGFKHFWLDRPFFLIRFVVYFAIWIGFATALVRHSRRQDVDGNLTWTRRNVRVSAAFLVVFAITVWLASLDWIMSLTPHWYSTMFGVYNFAGFFQSGVAAIILLVIWLERAGPLRGVVRTEHLHDLGKLLFAFSTFWMYTWFSQYMLIWYTNLTEETVYFIARMQTAWRPLVFTILTLNWLVPFLVLMSRPAKRNRGILVKVAVAVLVGHWLDLFVMILPSISPEAPPFGLPEVGALAVAVGLASLVFVRAFRQASPVPRKDVFLAESLHYHN